jgi:MFS family permease
MLLNPKPRDVARGFYGWPMLAGLSLAQVVSWGVLYYSFAVFVRPIEVETGWSRSQVTGAFSVALLVSGLASVFVGRWLDARGARGLMTAGSLAACLLLLALSRTTSLLAFYAIWAGLGVAMAMVLYEPAFAVVATWFVRQRDRALTALTLVGGLASTVAVPLASWLLDTGGWRAAAATLAVLLGLTTVPIHALWLRRSPASVGQWPDGDDAPTEGPPDTDAAHLRPVLKEGRFWALTTAFALSSFVSVAMGVHLIPYLGERQYSPMEAGTVLGLVGLMQLPGRVAYAPLRRGLRWHRAAGALFLAQGAAIVVLLASAGAAALIVFVCTFGMAGGMATLLRASAVAELYGRNRYGRVSGVVALVGTCGRAAGPVAAALLLAAWHSYSVAFAALAATLGAAALLVALPARPRHHEPIVRARIEGARSEVTLDARRAPVPWRERCG